MFKKIRKRNGSIVDFDQQKIVRAIQKAGEATGEIPGRYCRLLANRVLNLAAQIINTGNSRSGNAFRI
jgi:anaerobic ribonucleoside-triphosphate reductase